MIFDIRTEYHTTCCFSVFTCILHRNQMDSGSGRSCQSIEFGLLGLSIQIGWFIS